MKKWKRSGKKDVLTSMEEVTQLLSVYNAPACFILREQWSDHALTGNLHGLRELHLSQDDLLIYEIREEQKEIHLLDITTHEELRRRRP